MLTDFPALGQGVPATSRGANEWPLRKWRPLGERERRLFERFRSARFIIRFWEEADDLHNGCPGTADANLRDMLGGTIMYRSGHYGSDWDTPRDASLRSLVGLALWHCERCPALGADAIEHTGERLAASEDDVALDVELQLSVDITYVDAPGLFQISEGLIVLRDFRENTIEPIWRRFLKGRRDWIRLDFEKHDGARRGKTQRLPRLSLFRLFKSERRSKR